MLQRVQQPQTVNLIVCYSWFNSLGLSIFVYVTAGSTASDCQSNCMLQLVQQPQTVNLCVCYNWFNSLRLSIFVYVTAGSTASDCQSLCMLQLFQQPQTVNLCVCYSWFNSLRLSIFVYVTAGSTASDCQSMCMLQLVQQPQTVNLCVCYSWFNSLRLSIFLCMLQLVQQPQTVILGLILLQTTSEELACPREDLSVARKQELHRLLLAQVPTTLHMLNGEWLPADPVTGTVRGGRGCHKGRVTFLSRNTSMEAESGISFVGNWWELTGLHLCLYLGVREAEHV